MIMRPLIQPAIESVTKSLRSSHEMNKDGTHEMNKEGTHEMNKEEMMKTAVMTGR